MYHILERLHDFRRFGFLIVRKDSSNDNNSCQYDTKVQVIIGGLFHGCCLNRVSDKTQHCAKPEKHGKPSKQGLEKLNPFRCGWWRG